MGIIKDDHEFSERDKLLGHKRVYDRGTPFNELRSCGYKILHWGGDIFETISELYDDKPE